jgi:hypothetical protein
MEGQSAVRARNARRHAQSVTAIHSGIEVNNTILDFGNDPQWIGMFGNHKINDKDEMEIDWIDRIQWQYRDYQSLDNGAFSKVLPPH